MTHKIFGSKTIIQINYFSEHLLEIHQTLMKFLNLTHMS